MDKYRFTRPNSAIHAETQLYAPARYRKGIPLDVRCPIRSNYEAGMMVGDFVRFYVSGVYDGRAAGAITRMQFQTKEMLFALEKALNFKAQIENRNVSQANRYRVSILENELMNHTLSVVFVFKITSKTVFLQYCCPLLPEQYGRIQSSEYIPQMRSGKYLKVGHDNFMEAQYAFASIQFPLDTHALDFMTALEYIHKELEQYLNETDLKIDY